MPGGGNFWTMVGLIGLVIGGLLFLIFLVIFSKYIGLVRPGLYLACEHRPVESGGDVACGRSIPQVIVDAKIMAVQAGLDVITTREMEAHYLAGGNVQRLVRALIAAHRADIALDWETGAAIDLAGRNVFEAVQTSVDPKVIDCPDPRRYGRSTLGRRGQGRDSTESQSPRDGPHQSGPTRGRGDGRNRHRPRGRGDRLGDRFLRNAQRGAWPIR